MLLRSDGKLGIGLSPASGPLQLTGPRVGEDFGIPRGLTLDGELDFVEFAQSISALPEPQILADGDTYSIDLTQDDRESAKTLKRTLALSPSFFEPESVTLQGSIPFEAASMGTKETVKWITLTYLTIDRLVRGSVEVKQLHGPVGHSGCWSQNRGPRPDLLVVLLGPFVGQLGRVELPPVARG